MHYQRYRDHKYLGAWDFEDGDRLVTIARVEQGMIDRDDGAPPERVPLMYLVELDRPMVLNATNGALITAMYGSPDTRTWVGKQVWLMRGTTTNRQGQPIFGIRVKPERPPEPTAMSPDEELREIEALLARKRAALAKSAELPAPPPAPLATSAPEVAHDPSR